jgi:NDP-sugar pyrophosphorylase family protein
MMLPVAILAGGLATRLYPLTENKPKALIEIERQPFIVHQLNLLRRHGIERVVLCVGYLGKMIQESVGDGSRFRIQVEYSYDGPYLLGTGGSLKKALPLLGEAFFVLYGDSYLDCDYDAIQLAFIKSGKSALMTVFRNENMWDKSNVIYENNTIIDFDKKNPTPEMKYIDYGLGVLRRSVFKKFKKNEADLADIYKYLISRNDLAGCEVKQRFYEIGSKKGLEETNNYLKDYYSNRI